MYNSLQGGLLIYYLFYSWIGLIELLLLRLGITFSSNGKWSDHIDNICKSALKVAYTSGQIFEKNYEAVPHIFFINN